jgi:mevalonate kinase
VKIYAPGKLILSGEHAVVYGKPALAMAVNRYATATVTSQLSPMVSFDLSDLAYEQGLTFVALNRLKNQIKEKYERFIHGDFKIRDVLQKPVELAQYAFTLFLEALNLKLTQGVRIRLQSDIPIGCGMGSSAATVLSIIHAVAHHMKVDFSSELFFRLSLEAENMQHGRSSGLDLRVSQHGGCIFVKEGQIQQRLVPELPMYLVNTGAPTSTTGECVAEAAQYFKNSYLGDDFGAVTEAMDAALQTNQVSEIIKTIQANHMLLTKIGVVPANVQQFIREVESAHGAAKICGAGAVSGNQGGVVLVVTENIDALTALCARYHYAILSVTGEPRGVHVV